VALSNQSTLGLNIYLHKNVITRTRYTARVITLRITLGIIRLGVQNIHLSLSRKPIHTALLYILSDIHTLCHKE